MGGVRFFAKAEPAVEEANSALDWSFLESRFGELSKLSSETPTKLTIEPSSGLAHDPRDPLALLEQFTTQRRAAATGPQGAIDLPAVINPATEDQAKAGWQTTHRFMRSGLSNANDAFVPPKNLSMCAREFGLNAWQFEKRGI